MRITNLVLKDYKCFDNLTLDNLGERVVLVGPNGCGKSAILEAIAALKEFIGSYQPVSSPYGRSIALAQKYVPVAWPLEIPLPIRGDQGCASISATIMLDEMEMQITGVDQAEYVVSIQILRSGEVTYSSDISGIAKLFQHYDPASGIGVIDYISPNRTIPLQRVSQIDLNTLSLEQQRIELIELPKADNNYQKFKSVKQFIISQQFEDFTNSQQTEPRHDSLALLRELFAEFFPPKTLCGVSRSGNEMQVVVQTPSGIHDIDQLSSGERELFFVLVSLFRIRMLPSVILYDEPERHLNPGLEAKLVPAMDRLQTKNQIWIATHGMELISTVPLEQIVALKRAGSTGPPERFADSSSNNRIRIYESLGASVGLQLAYSQVVFVEGKNAQADKYILDRLIGKSLPGVLFVASGSSADAQGAATRASLLIQEASANADFFMVLDRDYRDENSLNDLKRRLNNRVFFWNCHEIENLLLNPTVLLGAMNMNGATNLTTLEEVDGALLGVARELEALFVCQMVTYRLNNNAEFPDIGRTGSPRDKDNLVKMINNRRDKLAKAFDPEQIDSLIATAEIEIKQSYGNGEWRSLLPGKEILDAFRVKYLPKLRGDFFIEHVLYAMVNDGVLPTELEKLCTFIKSR